MPQKRVTMRKVREILRLAWALGQSRRNIARSCTVGKSTVDDTLTRAAAAGLSWPLPSSLDDEKLEHLLYPPVARPVVRTLFLPDWPEMHRELRTHKHLTLMLLWQEYKEREPSGYQYS